MDFARPVGLGSGAFGAIGVLLTIIVGVFVMLVLSIGGLGPSSARTALIVAACGFAVLALLTGALAVYLSRAVLTPVRRVADAAVALTEGKLGTKVRGQPRGELSTLVRAFNAMSRTLEQRELSQRTTDERFQGILDNANAAIYVKDTDSWV
jgi:nitrogen fixation/metabolism regulation signal transduction histidine kinase